MKLAISGIAIAIAMLVFVAINGAIAGDPDGRWTNSQHHDWFKALKNKSGTLCCDGSDGHRVEDPDWLVDGKGQKYRVRLKGIWVDVPDAALITEHNRVGPAMVWPVYGPNGSITVRCFLAGALG